MIFIIYFVDELTKVGIVKKPNAESKASDTTDDTKSQEATSDPNNVATQGAESMADASELSQSEDIEPNTEIETESTANRTNQSAAASLDLSQSATASLDLIQSGAAADALSNLNSDEPMRRDLLQLVDALIMLYSISSHKVLQDPFYRQLLIKECESNIQKMQERLDSCPEGVSSKPEGEISFWAGACHQENIIKF